MWTGLQIHRPNIRKYFSPVRFLWLHFFSWSFFQRQSDSFVFKITVMFENNMLIFVFLSLNWRFTSGWKSQACQLGDMRSNSRWARAGVVTYNENCYFLLKYFKFILFSLLALIYHLCCGRGFRFKHPHTYGFLPEAHNLVLSVELELWRTTKIVISYLNILNLYYFLYLR